MTYVLPTSLRLTGKILNFALLTRIENSCNFIMLDGARFSVTTLLKLAKCSVGVGPEFSDIF